MVDDRKHDTTKTSIVIDDRLFELVRIEARRQEIASLSEMDELDLANEEVMTKAWRP